MPLQLQLQVSVVSHRISPNFRHAKENLHFPLAVTYHGRPAKSSAATLAS
jgi:hypothetical protein